MRLDLVVSSASIWATTKTVNARKYGQVRTVKNGHLELVEALVTLGGNHHEVH